MRNFEPNLVFRLVYLSGETFFAAQFVFDSVTAVEGESWGAIKSLFR